MRVLLRLLSQSTTVVCKNLAESRWCAWSNSTWQIRTSGACKLKAETAAGSGATEADIKETEETLVTAISDAKAAVDEGGAIGDGK